MPTLIFYEIGHIVLKRKQHYIDDIMKGIHLTQILETDGW